MPFTSCNAQKYKTKGGASPKFKTSANESSSAPNLLSLFNSRATRPSNPSRTPASKISWTALWNLLSKPCLIAVTPRHIAAIVIILGNNWLSESSNF